MARSRGAGSDDRRPADNLAALARIPGTYATVASPHAADMKEVAENFRGLKADEESKAKERKRERLAQRHGA
jgi:hypothetical protein